MKSTLIRWIPAAVVMASIFFTSSRSGDDLNGWLPWMQKWLPGLTDFNPMHYVAYFGLGLAVSIGLGRRSPTWAGVLLNVAVCVAYGLTDEWHQSYVPMRTPDGNDLLHDAIGAGAAALLVFVFLRTRRSRNYTVR